MAAQNDPEMAEEAVRALVAAHTAARNDRSAATMPLQRLQEHDTRIADVDRHRQQAVHDHDDASAAELRQLEDRLRAEDTIAQWAAAEATFTQDPERARAWRERLPSLGIDPDAVHRAAGHPRSPRHPGPPPVVDIEQLAADYVALVRHPATVTPRTPTGRYPY